jgi:hypothetical protein
MVTATRCTTARPLEPTPITMSPDSPTLAGAERLARLEVGPSGVVVDGDLGKRRRPERSSGEGERSWPARGDGTFNHAHFSDPTRMINQPGHCFDDGFTSAAGTGGIQFAGLSSYGRHLPAPGWTPWGGSHERRYQPPRGLG